VAQKPVDKEVAHRFAELVGHGLTQHEAAGAVGIGTRTGERLMTKPEIRQIVAETRTRSGMGDGDPEILALLGATDEEGNPDWERRVQGAELYLESAEVAASTPVRHGALAHWRTRQPRTSASRRRSPDSQAPARRHRLRCVAVPVVRRHQARKATI
jgi:hypothetical protein